MLWPLFRIPEVVAYESLDCIWYWGMLQKCKLILLPEMGTIGNQEGIFIRLIGMWFVLPKGRMTAPSKFCFAVKINVPVQTRRTALFTSKRKKCISGARCINHSWSSCFFVVLILLDKLFASKTSVALVVTLQLTYLWWNLPTVVKLVCECNLGLNVFKTT